MRRRVAEFLNITPCTGGNEGFTTILTMVERRRHPGFHRRENPPADVHPKIEIDP